VSYDRLLAMVESYTPAEVSNLDSASDATNLKDLKLKGLIMEDDKKRGKRIAAGMGKSEAGAKKRAKELNLAV
jgi:hypothetical protein